MLSGQEGHAVRVGGVKVREACCQGRRYMLSGWEGCDLRVGGAYCQGRGHAVSVGGAREIES